MKKTIQITALFVFIINALGASAQASSLFADSAKVIISATKAFNATTAFASASPSAVAYITYTQRVVDESVDTRMIPLQSMSALEVISYRTTGRFSLADVDSSLGRPFTFNEAEQVMYSLLSKQKEGQPGELNTNLASTVFWIDIAGTKSFLALRYIGGHKYEWILDYYSRPNMKCDSGTKLFLKPHLKPKK